MDCAWPVANRMRCGQFPGNIIRRTLAEFTRKNHNTRVVQHYARCPSEMRSVLIRILLGASLSSRADEHSIPGSASDLSEYSASGISLQICKHFPDHVLFTRLSTLDKSLRHAVWQCCVTNDTNLTRLKHLSYIACVAIDADGVQTAM